MNYLLQIYPRARGKPSSGCPMTSGRRSWRSTSRSRSCPVSSPARQLQPVETATTVRVENGETLLTDGPFVDAKEHVGGFFLVEADDLDAALELAARIPAARMGGAVEVRPLVKR